jgi:CheY-specific phosphatase CheX
MKENMKKIQETMRLSIFEVFKKMFYIFLEPLDDESDEYDMEAAIRFEGFLSGEIRILLSRKIAKTMIQNMLNIEEDKITEHVMEDCLKEAVNMVCGNFLGKLDSTKVFNLSIPVFKEQSGDLEFTENACKMDFDSDSGRVCVIIEVT